MDYELKTKKLHILNKKFFVNLQSICLGVGKENSDWNQEQGWQFTKVINGRNYVD